MNSELPRRAGDAHIVLSQVKGKAALTMFEASAKLLAKFVMAQYEANYDALRKQLRISTGDIELGVEVGDATGSRSVLAVSGDVARTIEAIRARDAEKQEWLEALPEASRGSYPVQIEVHEDRHALLRHLDQLNEVTGAVLKILDGTAQSAITMRTAAQALLDDVRRRYPGEELRCEYMKALDDAVRNS